MKQIHVEKLAALVSAHTEEELRENKLCGKEVIVHQNGECIYHETFGCSAVGGPTLQKNMLYRAASMTKPITAAAVALLADHGKLDLNAPASDFYPQMKNLQVATLEDGKIVSLRPAKNVIRVKDLLSHTSGIGCSPVIASLREPDAALPLRDAIQVILNDPLYFEPLTDQAYGNATFDVAAGIVEIASGMAFDAYLKENLFDPLGMTDTTFDPDAAQWARMVAMFNRTPEGKGENAETPAGCVFENEVPARLSAGAGLATTAGDYIRFADMLCLGGVSTDGVRVLSEKMARRMGTPNVPDCVDMGCERWGFGMRVITAPGYPHSLGVGCFGWSGAYGTHFWVDPENKLAVVMMKNAKYDGGAGNQSACALERDVSASLE